MAEEGITFGPGFFENLSHYKKILHKPSQEPIQEPIQEKKADIQPQPIVPNWIPKTEKKEEVENTIENKREAEIKEISNAVIPLRAELISLQEEYIHLVDNDLSTLKSIRNNDSVRYIEENPCSHQYSTLASCIHDSQNNKSLERGSISNAGYIVHKF